MTTDQIEQAAMELLGLYTGRYGMDDSAAIPVDMVVESALGLTLELDDLSKRLGAQDILGATWIQSKTVVIDQSLEPSENPAMEGRFNFTLAHEAGHWVMHAHQIADIPEQATLFYISTAPSIVCRSSQRKDSMEWQADRFASYLLMPEDRIINFWREIRGGIDQYMAFEENEAIKGESESVSACRCAICAPSRMPRHSLFRNHISGGPGATGSFTPGQRLQPLRNSETLGLTPRRG